MIRTALGWALTFWGVFLGGEARAALFPSPTPGGNAALDARYVRQSVAGAISGSFSGPALQVLNNGAGNALELYTSAASYLIGQGLAVSQTSPILGPNLSIVVDGSTRGEPNGFNGVGGGSLDFGGPNKGSAMITLADQGGWAKIASHYNGTDHPDFDGAHVWVGDDATHYGGMQWRTFATQTNEYLEFVSIASDKGGGRFAWSDQFSSGINTTILDLHGGPQGFCWAWRARSPGGYPNGSDGGGWLWYITNNTPAQMPIHTTWRDQPGNDLMRLMHAGGLQILGAGNKLTLGSSANAAGSVVPGQDNTGAVGIDTARWASVRAVTVVTGDIGFEDEVCAICGRAFLVGDDVVWRIRRQKGSVSYAVPIHAKEAR